MELAPYLREHLCTVIDQPMTRDDLLRRFSEAVDSLLPDVNSDALTARLIDREEQSPTSTDEGVAFPHAIAPDIDTTVVAAARISPGVDFGVKRHPRCDLVFCMFGSSKDPWEHVRLLARLARIVHTADARKRLRSAKTADELYQRLLQEDRSHG